MNLRFSLLGLMAPLASTGAVLLTGCAASACSLAGPNWPERLELVFPHQYDLTAEITILDSARISFRGPNGGDARTIGRAELLELVSILKDFNPRPWLIFRISEGVDCVTVRDLRAELERRAVCDDGNCISGEVWDRTFHQN